MSRRVDWALVASLFCLALVLRLVPLWFSPLPYNVDGYSLVKIAQGIDATGHWTLNPADPNIDDLKLPVFSLLWSVQAQLGGMNPLTDIQWFLPILTSLVVLPVYLLAVKATGNRRAAYASALFLASAVMKESLALLLLPPIVLTFRERADPRKRAIAALLLLVLVFLHHLTLLIAVGAVGALILLDYGRARVLGRRSSRALGLDLATGLGPFAVGWAYYAAVNLGTVPSAADQLALFAAIMIVLGALLVRAWRPAPVRPRRIPFPPVRVLLVPGLAIVGVLVYARVAVFAGTLETTPGLLSLLPGVVLLAALAVLGFGVVRRTANRANDVVLALAVGPVALALFGFLRGLDSFSLRVVYRSFDYLDYTFALCAGIGFAILWARQRPHRSTQIALAAVFLGALLATTPMAWDTQGTFGVNNVVTPGEFQALSVTASLGASALASDQRMTAVGRWWFGLQPQRTLPYALEGDAALPDSGYAVVLERWTSVGAQEFPGANVAISPHALSGFLAANRILYVSGTPGDRVYVVQITGLA